MRFHRIGAFIAIVSWAVILTLNAAHSLAQEKNDVQIVKRRLMEETLAPAPWAAETMQPWLRKMRPDGGFSDIDYADNKRTGFKAFTHLDRLHRLALAWRKPPHPFAGKPEIRDAILKGMDHWFDNDYQNPNWWWQTIGIPLTLFRIMFLMEDELGDEPMKRGLVLLERGKIGMTGQNLVWVANITAARACLIDDPQLLATSFKAIADTICISAEEGIQADYSFWQHGNCQYSGGYGQGFSIDCSRYALLGRDTRFAFPPEKIDILSRYILDGQQWMMRGKFFDYAAKGREISRKSASGSGMAGACRNMAQLGAPRRAEFEAFADRVAAGNASPENAIEGNRHFWRCDYMAHHRRGYFTSAKMHSSRIVNTDGPSNEEGLLSHYLSDGATYIFRKGDEYDNIFGAWDWSRVPGCTIEQKPIQGGPRRQGTTAFAGGVSDGQYGLAAFDFERDGLKARKAWFYFDDEFVCLGTGISCPSAFPVLTSLDQCHLRGDVQIGRAAGPAVRIEKGEHAFGDLRWLHHNGVGYVFPVAAPVVVKNEAQPCDWYRVSHSFKNKDRQENPLDVFSLWIDHGAGPSEGGYEYIVAPDMPLERMTDYAARPPIEVLYNTSDVQAVRHTGLGIAGFAFYHPMRIDIPGMGYIGVDREALVLVRGKGSEWEVAVANPLCRQVSIDVSLGMRLEGEGAVGDGAAGTCIRFDLPGGLEAGKSVVRNLRMVK